MKLNRLLEITLILLNKSSVTAKEFAARFDVSTRTIFRDIDELSGAAGEVRSKRDGAYYRGGGVQVRHPLLISHIAGI